MSIGGRLSALRRARRRRRARRAGSLWVTRVEQGLSQAERPAFESFIADPLNAREFHELRAIGDVAAELDGNARAELVRSIAEPDASGRPRPARGRLWVGGAAAAVLVLALAVAWVALRSAGYLPETYQTATGQSRRVVLPDGSVAYLNTRTELEWVGGPDDRRVRLRRGEAFFEVVHEPQRPFRILLAHSEVRDLGTRFDVYQKADGNVVVTVVSGAVSVEGLGTRRGGPSWMRRLDANQQIEYSPVGLLADVHAAIAPDAIRWREGMVETQGEPLSRFVSNLSRYTEERIVIVDPRAASQRIGGAFSIRNVDATLARIARIAPVTVTQENGEVILGFRSSSGAGERGGASPP